MVPGMTTSAAPPSPPPGRSPGLSPDLSPRAAELKKAREERLAAALRENLRKRKAQERTRDAQAAPAGAGTKPRD